MATGKKCLVLPAPWSPNCCKIAISLIDPVSDPRPATSQLHPDLYPAHPPQRSAAPSSSVKSAQQQPSTAQHVSAQRAFAFPLPVKLPGGKHYLPLITTPPPRVSRPGPSGAGMLRGKRPNPQYPYAPSRYVESISKSRDRESRSAFLLLTVPSATRAKSIIITNDR